MIAKNIAALLMLSAAADQAFAAPSHAHRDLHAVDKKIQARGVNSKRGIAYNDATLAKNVLDVCTKCGWAYSWESDNKGFSSLPFIPTMKDSSDLFTSTFDQNAEGLAANSGVVFSLNEPDHDSQANLPVETAVTLHTQHTSKFVNKYEITTPSVTSDAAAGKGLEYLTQWISACSTTPGCHYDSCNIHWYGPVGSEGEFIPYVQKAHDVCGKDIWVTEFGYYDYTATADQAKSFISSAVPQLDSLDYVKGYAYFMARAGAQTLNNDDGSVNEVGKLYGSL